MGVFQNNLMGAAAAAASAGGAGFYDHQIANSLRGQSNSRLQQSINSAASSGTKVAISFWHKMANAGTATGTTGLFTAFSSETDIVDLNIQTWGSYSIVQSFQFSCQDGSGSYGCKWADAGEQNDPSAFKHIVLILDSTQGTSTNRAKLYINGDQKTTSNTMAAIPSNHIWHYTKNSSTMNIIERYSSGYGNVFDGYLSEVVLIDGSASISDFGETKNGVWIPKDPSGLTFGNNGYYLKFESSSDLGNDSSGNNNDFSVTNISAHDQMLDSPTFNSDSNGGNFATLGPLWKTPNMTFSEGNLKWTTSTNQRGAMSNWSIPLEGKYYFEYVPLSWGYQSGDDQWIGLNIATVDFTASRGGNPTCYGYGATGRKIDGDGTEDSYGASWATDDIIGVAVDRVNDTIQFSKNGSFQGSAFAIPATADLFPWVGSGGGSSSASGVFNFGQDGTFAGNVTAGGNSDDTGYGNFKYDPPTGFLALCCGNLLVADAIDPAQTDDNYPQKLFNATLWTGTDADINVPVGFKPDWVWLKNRGATYNHYLFDSSRGVTKIIRSDGNNTESTTAESLKAFISTGFTYGDDATGNENNANMVSWNWRANGSTTSSGSGDLTSTHQVDPSGGFSIVKAVGDGSGSGDKTVTHGMSAAPDCIIAKNLDSTFNWDTYWSSGLTSGYALRLNTTDGQLSGRWGTVNSSIFTCKWNYTWIGSDNFIYYCFRNLEGYIKVGKYVGNGDGSDGTFVYTGFKPAFLLVRKVGTNNWRIQDNTRDPYNPVYHMLVPNSTAAEDAYTDGTDYNDFLSNGFKLARGGDAANWNASGSTYVYLAMAHNPFKYATAR